MLRYGEACMTEEVARRLLERLGVICHGHFPLTSGKHSDVYINKDALYPHIKETSFLCRGIAKEFIRDDVDAVIGPALGGINLSQWVAEHLSDLCEREVISVFAEREEDTVYAADEYSRMRISREYVLYSASGATLAHYGDPVRVTLGSGEKIVRKGRGFVIRRGYDALIAGKRILVVEDNITTGGSAREVIRAVRAASGTVVGFACLVNRGGVESEDVENPPKFFSLLSMALTAWDEAECPLCRAGIPINTGLGKR